MGEQPPMNEKTPRRIVMRLTQHREYRGMGRLLAECSDGGARTSWWLADDGARAIAGPYVTPEDAARANGCILQEQADA